ncbi:MAG: hypothetical protein II336_02145 [Loktanella sp.]|nr:hypothetical protein [Loktanella sp.]
MSTNKTQFKVNLTADERSQIEAAKKAAGYKSLSAYMRDSALRKESVDLLSIACEIGRLGQIVNDIMLKRDPASGDDLLHGDDAKKAARRIIKACDAVSDALRWR